MKTLIHIGLFVPLFTAALAVRPLPGPAEPQTFPIDLKPYEQIHAALLPVARLMNDNLNSSGAGFLRWNLKDLGFAVEDGKKLASAETPTATDIANFSKRLHRDVGRLVDASMDYPGRIDVSSATAPSRFVFPQGRHLVVLNHPGDKEALPEFTRILMDAEASSSQVIQTTGEGPVFALLEIADLPIGRNEIEIHFKGKKPVDHKVIIETRKPDHLVVQIREAPDGEKVPALISLVSLSDRTYRIPAEAIDFSSHFDDGPATHKLMILGAPFWKELTTCCVEGTATYEIFPGKWRLSVAKGIEYEPVIEEFEFKEGQDIEKIVELKRWIDMRDRKWYSGDGHVHSFQQNDEQRERIAAWANAMDVHVVNTMMMGDIRRTYFEHEGFGKEYRYASGDTVLVPGQECPRTAEIGHTQALNLGSSMVRDVSSYYLYDTMFDGAHAQGALTGYCHAGWLGFHVDRDMSLNVPQGKVDMFEMLQFSDLTPDYWYDFLNLGCRVTAMAGSDVPWGGVIGEVRAYAFVEQEPYTPDGWFDAVKKGRTFVTNGPMLDLAVDGKHPGDEIHLEKPGTVRIDVHAWGNRLIGQPQRLEVIAHGDVIGSATIGSSQPGDLRIHLAYPVHEGLWIAARCKASNGALAHTSPVYVKVAGSGFEKRSDLPNLLVKREKSLKEIEELVATERSKNPEGPIAQQGEALLERVRTARDIYKQLENKTIE